MKTIVITGCTRGLGRVLAQYYAAVGQRVAGCGRRPDLVEQLQRQLGSGHRCATVDVRDNEKVSAWAARIVEDFGPPDLLLNNAAITVTPAPLWTLTAQEVEDVVDINIKGTVNVIRHFLPAMIGAGRGVIVNFSSGWGRSTDPGVAPYCASKWAIEGLTQALAQELPRGLCAVALNPGIIDTDMLRQCWAGEAGRYPPPEQWVEKAGPFLLGLGPDDNGRSLDVP